MTQQKISFKTKSEIKMNSDTQNLKEFITGRPILQKKVKVVLLSWYGATYIYMFVYLYMYIHTQTHAYLKKKIYIFNVTILPL